MKVMIWNQGLMYISVQNVNKAGTEWLNRTAAWDEVEERSRTHIKESIILS